LAAQRRCHYAVRAGHDGRMAIVVTTIVDEVMMIEISSSNRTTLIEFTG
jgi:hypothetical protein